MQILMRSTAPAPALTLAVTRWEGPARELVYARTRALALSAGRIPPHVLQADYEQARRELTGESDMERQDAVLAGLGRP